MNVYLAIVLAVVVTMLAAWAYFTAQRLNRLHIRTDSALAQLMSALDRRDALVAALEPGLRELAQSSLSIPGAPEFVEAKAKADSDLKTQLQTRPVAADIVDASARVELAARFYNDAVTSTRALRTRPLVRFLHLGGTAQLPRYFDVNE
ncbi:putative secreted protein [Corynebacterium renale]|uniref:hypothetical protein n=1 Tax=Corynebacterium renale TaxID=1724 RepID=UPI000DA30637|nr:hypothetical protein [Corynebacterium renale]SQG64801.1 putative secreted protein [Corynebacterium renale]STC96297.1 putative secreted protein [Corynebacterium renale]